MFCHIDLRLGEPQNVAIAKIIYTSPKKSIFTWLGVIFPYRDANSTILSIHITFQDLWVLELRENKVCKTGSTRRKIKTNLTPSDFNTPSHQIPQFCLFTCLSLLDISYNKGSTGCTSKPFISIVDWKIVWCCLHVEYSSLFWPKGTDTLATVGRGFPCLFLMADVLVNT